MKLIQAQETVDKYEVAQVKFYDNWNSFMNHVKRDLTHSIAEKIYNENLIEFKEQEDINGFTSIKAHFFISSMDEARKINALIQNLKNSDHREEALELERIINDKKQ